MRATKSCQTFQSPPITPGDSDAFVTLYRRYQETVYRFAFQLSRSESVAEDITQDAFLTLSRGARQYNASQARFKTYLYGMVRHMARRRLRPDRGFVFLTGWHGDRLKAHEPLIEQALVEAVSRKRSIERVQRAVLSLPSRCREMVVLCNLDGRIYTEAPATAGCAAGTVRSRLHRGRALLRRN